MASSQNYVVLSETLSQTSTTFDHMRLQFAVLWYVSVRLPRLLSSCTQVGELDGSIISKPGLTRQADTGENTSTIPCRDLNQSWILNWPVAASKS